MKRLMSGMVMCAACFASSGALAQMPVVSSEHYEVLLAPAAENAGGGVASGAGIRIDASNGGTSAGGLALAGGTQVRASFTGQICDPVELSVWADPASVVEGGRRQMQATAVLDDDSIVHPDPARMVWCESSDALTGVDSDGGAIAGVVFEDEVAVVRGIYQLVCDAIGFELMVLNTNPDNFGSYAGDGLPDDWQVGWFGIPPNDDAAPEADPDSDGRDNRFEYLSGFSPLDVMERFELRVTGVNRAEGTATLQLNRMIPNRTYTLSASPDLDVGFEVISVLPAVHETETDREFHDTGAMDPQLFYRIGISEP